MPNLCLDCKNARPDLCEKIRSLETPKIRRCKRFVKDCRRLSLDEILKTLRCSTQTYYANKQEYGNEWVLERLEEKGVFAFIDDEENEKLRFYVRL